MASSDAPGIGAITVPYGPKSSPFAPKFVDPKTMIGKKTDLLSNLFGGVGPVNYPGATPSGYSKFGSPVLYATNDVEPIQSYPAGAFGTGKNEVSGVKRAIFGPKFGPAASPYGPFGPSSIPFGPFGPFGAKFAPGFASPYSGVSPSYGGYDSSLSSRRRRSIVGAEPGAPKDLGPPPAYPGLGTIAEEPESGAPAATPKEYLPGLFGPFGPFGAYGAFGPAAPAIDPSLFTAKKTSFFDTLFSNMAASTPATVADEAVANPTIVPPGFWSPVETVTDVPVPKSTIVPPGFWAPSAIIPSPTEYTDKVNFFLGKLFTSIAAKKLTAASNATAADSTAPKSARSVKPESEITKVQVARSIDDLGAISAAKDAIVDAIIAELGSLKTDMANNLDDLIVAQKIEAAKPTPGKKPVKPIKAAFAGFWGPPPVDTTLPFKQKMSVLSQVFDMLTDLQKNITVAVTDAIKTSVTTDAPVEEDEPVPNYPGAYYYPVPTPAAVPVFNISFLDAIKSKLASLDTPTPLYQPSIGYGAGKFARAISKGPSPFYLPYPGSEPVKRNANDQDDVYEHHEHDNNDADQYKRAVKMSMHQGYQSMPPGTVESVEAGGGSTPDHQGGGINLLVSLTTLLTIQPQNW